MLLDFLKPFSLINHNQQDGVKFFTSISFIVTQPTKKIYSEYMLAHQHNKKFR